MTILVGIEKVNYTKDDVEKHFYRYHFTRDTNDLVGGFATFSCQSWDDSLFDQSKDLIDSFVSVDYRYSKDYKICFLSKIVRCEE